MATWRIKKIQLPRTVFLVCIFVSICFLILLRREQQPLKLIDSMDEISLGKFEISIATANQTKATSKVTQAIVEFHPVSNSYVELTKEEMSGGKLNISQDDERLLKYIRTNHLTRPPTTGVVDDTPFDPNVRKTEQQEVYRFILNLLGNKNGGFFIECGANDGEFFSNTLPLELNQNWTGLLIEADPRPLKRLLRRNRKAWVSNTCLSTTPYPKKIEMLRNDKAEGLSFIPGLRKFIGEESDYYRFEAQCVPIYSILKAINVTSVDYFSLDIEGAELGVLKTIPWDCVLIKTLSIEVHPEYVNPVKKFMTSVGYKYVKFIQNGYSHDQIYVHSSVMVENPKGF